MASSGHGVSDAVRNHISIWMTPEVAKAAGKSLSALRTPGNWKRKARRNSPSGFGFERDYACTAAPDIRLIVHSPPEDYSADRYVFMVNGRAIGGGKTKLKSVLTSSATSHGDKTTLTASAKAEEYVPLSDAELLKIATNMRYGDKNDFAFLELERG